ncbi:hypothetical protein [Microbacterium sp. LMI1-1-1.1]|uniref:hypothetical protein n=1 Tax=Microbacterium sp. LMI1-1-1.1 TaxID=3135223 RepID=UPI0034674AA1
MQIERMLLSGDTVRSIEATARTRTEWFSVIWHPVLVLPGTMSIGDVPGSVIGEQAFSGASDEAFLIWDARVPDAAQGDPVAWFGGNELRNPPPPLERDASDLPVLPDDEFWPFIDALDRKLWNKTLRAAAGRLAEQPEEFILRWAQTAALKAVALADVLESVGIDVSYEIHAIGAVLCQGQRTFDAVLSDADVFELTWGNDNSWLVISLANYAFERKATVGVNITTAFTARESEIRAREAEAVAEYQRQRGIEPEPEQPLFAAARAVVRTEGALRERIAFVPARMSSERAVEALARDALTADGSSIVAGPEFALQSVVGPEGGEAFAIKRRSSVDVDAYVKFYASVPPR